MSSVRRSIFKAYGFIADPTKPTKFNACEQLKHTPTWYYFSRPNNLAFHDFTKSTSPPKNLKSLLGLGLKFIPTPKHTNSWNKVGVPACEKLRRSLHLKFHFAADNKEADNIDLRMYIRSNWTPPEWTFPKAHLQDRLQNFEAELKPQFLRRRGKPNLLQHQQRALDALQTQRKFLIAPCDKNLGPAVIETSDYISMAFRDHLSDRKTYKRLSEQECNLLQTQITKSLEAWLKKFNGELTKMERKFLLYNKRTNENPFSRFYLTLKAHKLKPGQTVDDLKSRPIVSCPGSELHPIGIWTDRKLQVVAKKQDSYFKNSQELKQQLLELGELPPNARLFTADAVSMYTNIPTRQALRRLGPKLRNYRRQHDRDFPADAVLEALRLIMTQNVFSFGDMKFLQLDGTAMGTPPAPPYANTYFGSFEDEFLKRFMTWLIIFYKRFIDDVIGIILLHSDPVIREQQWADFKQAMNSAPGLVWEFTEPSTQVDFMDMTIKIENNRLTTTLFEKPLNLHLYIPPHSAHPPGLLPGMVQGTCHRIFTLCSDNEDRIARLKTFYKRLMARGYKPEQLRPLFGKAIRAYQGPAQTATAEKPNSVIFHLPYHPNDPPSSTIQRAWKHQVAAPKYRMPLTAVRNPNDGSQPNIQRLIIVYKRPMNLGNLLSHRNLEELGPPVSSYWTRDG